MNQRTNRGAGFLYAMAAGVVISVYVPFLIGIVSNDERNHDYDGPAMMISKGMGMLGLILGGILLMLLLLLWKRMDHRVYAKVASVFKIGFIPAYLYGMVLMMFSTLLVVIPLLGLMLTASTWFACITFGYVLLVIGTVPQLMAIIKARREGIVPKHLVWILAIASCFFVADVIAVIVLRIVSRMRRKEPTRA